MQFLFNWSTQIILYSNMEILHSLLKSPSVCFRNVHHLFLFTIYIYWSPHECRRVSFTFVHCTIIEQMMDWKHCSAQNYEVCSWLALHKELFLGMHYKLHTYSYTYISYYYIIQLLESSVRWNYSAFYSIKFCKRTYCTDLHIYYSYIRMFLRWF